MDCLSRLRIGMKTSSSTGGTWSADDDLVSSSGTSLLPAGKLGKGDGSTEDLGCL